VLTAEYVATVALTFAVAPLCISAFSAAKQAIPLLHPFTWDAYLSAWGSFVDGGRPMWRRLQPVLGKPEITASLDWFYHRAWTALLLAAFVWTALLRPSHLRRRFLFAFVALFLIVGNVFALALASAGPAYYDLVTSGGHHPYADLLTYLRAVDAQTPLMSVRGESALWYAYSHRVQGFGYGVSAMPSMHVATAVLTAFFGFAYSRLLGVLLTIVALCTFAASVELGWHYALDGYVGALLAAGVWWLAGRVTRPGTA
jgi:membrane-associated phospholipid phosphatase